MEAAAAAATAAGCGGSGLDEVGPPGDSELPFPCGSHRAEGALGCERERVRAQLCAVSVASGACPRCVRLQRAPRRSCLLLLRLRASASARAC